MCCKWILLLTPKPPYISTVKLKVPAGRLSVGERRAEQDHPICCHRSTAGRRALACRGKPFAHRIALGLHPEGSLATSQNSANLLVPSRVWHGNWITNCPRRKQNRWGSSGANKQSCLQPGNCTAAFLKPCISMSASVSLVAMFQMHPDIWRCMRDWRKCNGQILWIHQSLLKQNVKTVHGMHDI